uniref:Uncharacterized protein n=1 Tax=Sphaerodactylus townsendi TaxID=933632 RepID=A0ACB8EBK3_9SAUR
MADINEKTKRLLEDTKKKLRDEEIEQYQLRREISQVLEENQDMASKMQHYLNCYLQVQETLEKWRTAAAERMAVAVSRCKQTNCVQMGRVYWCEPASLACAERAPPRVQPNLKSDA